MQRRFRDKGWIETDRMLACGLKTGLGLEVGSGPGYLGLEWLKKTRGTRLKGIDISADMIELARKNALEYGYTNGRVEYILSSADMMPFDDNTFDVVFSNGSLHEWEHPVDTFNQMQRVLKPGGLFFVSDLRRDMNFLVKGFMYLVTRPRQIRPGLITSIRAAYTPNELAGILQKSVFNRWKIKPGAMGIEITGQKDH